MARSVKSKVKEYRELIAWAREQLASHLCQCEDCKSAVALIKSLEREGKNGKVATRR